MGVREQEYGRTDQEIENSHDVGFPKTVREVADDHAAS